MPAKKRKAAQSFEEVLARPWCYYCDRDFDDDKVLIDHQKAKHFQCHVGSCHRRLNTVGGLKVHMAQVHKEELTEVPNANAGRKDLTMEIFGMVGVPEYMIDARNAALTKVYMGIEAEHMRNTGNPISGSQAAKERNEAGSNKKPKLESTSDLKARVAAAKAKSQAKKAAQAPGNGTPPNGQDEPAQDTPNPPANAFGGPGYQSDFNPALYMSSSSPPAAMGFSNPAWIAPPAGAFTNYRDPAPLVTKSTPASQHPILSTNDDADMRSAFLPGYADQDPVPVPRGMTPEPRPAPTMTKDQVQAEVDGLWDMFTAQKAAGMPAQATESKVAASPVTTPAAPQPLKTKASSKGTSGTPKLVLSADKLVSPEEKRARATRYQPKPKASTMPTFIPTQGVAGVVDA